MEFKKQFKEKLESSWIIRVMLIAFVISSIWIIIDYITGNLEFNLLHDIIVLISAIIIEYLFSKKKK